MKSINYYTQSLNLLEYVKDINLEKCSFDLQTRSKNIFTDFLKPNTFVYVLKNKDCLNQDRYSTPEHINSELPEKKILEKYVKMDHLIATYGTLQIHSNKFRDSFPPVRNNSK